MDLTPQLFRDVQFTERRGAYDKDEVNAFLARVGTAVGQMQERLREAQRRVEATEDHIAKLEAAAREQKDADETLRRTLVLAQRTADAAVSEAKDEAEGIVADARQRADEMLVQAEEAVRRDVGATRDRLEAEIRDLEGHRDEMLERIKVIDSHLETERARLHAELDAIKDVLDDPSRATIAPVPGDEPESVIVLSDPPAAESPADDEDLSHLPPPPEDWQPESTGTGSTPAAPAEPTTPGGDEPAVGEPQDEPGNDDPAPRGLFGSIDEIPDSDGPPTEAHPVVGAGGSFGSSHLDELRRAVSDESAESEADAAMAAFFDQDNDEEPSRRFGRRR
ncbi:MAG: DivIVA domain-containing protein [Acidimicrobiales bacterium]|nr:DivIVA domain-containing protein [Acidimicrobiales bacterium]